MDRHEVQKAKQKPIELARKEARDPEEIRRWFSRLEAVLTDSDLAV